MAHRVELFDLHVHSTGSDGTMSLLQLADLARCSGLAGFAITDHDVLPDFAAIQSAGQRFAVDILGGIELSAELDGRGIHVLGYNVAVDDPALNRACDRLRSERRRRWTAMCRELAEQGILRHRHGAPPAGAATSPGRTHLARDLVRAGYAPTIRAAFARFVNRLESARQWQRPSARDAISLIRAAGGAAVLAHPPFGLRPEEWQALMEAGLNGVEARYPTAARRQVRFLENLARENGWIATGGSDFHGDDFPNFLGRCAVEREIVTALRMSRAAAV
jgi:predicted metal-dependent phosphoesterase TrpH